MSKRFNIHQGSVRTSGDGKGAAISQGSGKGTASSPHVHVTTTVDNSGNVKGSHTKVTVGSKTSKPLQTNNLQARADFYLTLANYLQNRINSSPIKTLYKIGFLFLSFSVLLFGQSSLKKCTPVERAIQAGVPIGQTAASLYLFTPRRSEIAGLRSSGVSTRKPSLNQERIDPLVVTSPQPSAAP